MSLPNIPDINPDITLNRCEVINLLLSSIAMEEIGISHILNAEGEKLQAVLKKKPNCLKSYLSINDNINRTLRTIIKSQLLLQMKLEDIIELESSHCCKKRKKHPDQCKGCNKLDCSCQQFNPCS